MTGEIYIFNTSSGGATVNLIAPYDFPGTDGVTVATVVRYIPRNNTVVPVLSLLGVGGSTIMRCFIENGRMAAYFPTTGVYHAGSNLTLQANVTYCMVWAVGVSVIGTQTYLRLSMYAAPVGAALEAELDLDVPYSTNTFHQLHLNYLPDPGVPGPLIMRSLAVWPKMLSLMTLMDLPVNFNRTVSATINNLNIPILWVDWEYTASDLGLDLMGIQAPFSAGRHSWCGVERSASEPALATDNQTWRRMLAEDFPGQTICWNDRYYSRGNHNWNAGVPFYSSACWAATIIGRPYSLTEHDTFLALAETDPDALFNLTVNWDGEELCIGTAEGMHDVWRPTTVKIPVSQVAGILAVESSGGGGEIIWAATASDVYRINRRGQMCRLYVANSWVDVHAQITTDIFASIVDLGVNADYTDGIVTTGTQCVVILKTPTQLVSPDGPLVDLYRAIVIDAWDLSVQGTYDLRDTLKVGTSFQKVIGVTPSPTGEYWLIAHQHEDAVLGAPIYFTRVTFAAANTLEIHGRIQMPVTDIQHVSRVGKEYLMLSSDRYGTNRRAITYLLRTDPLLDVNGDELNDVSFQKTGLGVDHTLPFAAMSMVAPGIGLSVYSGGLKYYYDDLGDWVLQLSSRGGKVEIYLNGKYVTSVNRIVVVDSLGSYGFIDRQSVFLWREVSLTYGTAAPVALAPNQDVEGLLDIPSGRLPHDTIGRFLHDLANMLKRTYTASDRTSQGYPVLLEVQDKTDTVRRWVIRQIDQTNVLMEDMTTRHSLMDALSQIGSI